MQNPHAEDMLNNTIDKSKYSNCVYVKSDNAARFTELEADGYEVVEDSDLSEMTLMGLPKTKAEIKDEKEQAKANKAEAKASEEGA